MFSGASTSTIFSAREKNIDLALRNKRSRLEQPLGYSNLFVFLYTPLHLAVRETRLRRNDDDALAPFGEKNSRVEKQRARLPLLVCDTRPANIAVPTSVPALAAIKINDRRWQLIKGNEYRLNGDTRVEERGGFLCSLTVPSNRR